MAKNQKKSPVKLSRQFPTRTLPSWRPLIYFVLIVLGCTVLFRNQQKPQPLRITRTLGFSTQSVDVLWLSRDISTLITADTNRVAYAISLDGDSMIAFETNSDSTKWKVNILPFDHQGVRGILANQNTVFITAGDFVDTYESMNGKLKWSTKLGEEHVSVIPQLDGDVLRIYYGDKLLELDPETGKIITSKPRGDIIWIVGNIELHTLSTNQLSAFDRHTNKKLWTLERSIFITEEWKPEESEEGIQIVGYQALWSDSLVKEICALNLQMGQYNWCHTENYISNIVIDRQSQLGYVMRADFVIEVIDLQTGNILREIRFLPSVLSEEMLRFSHKYSITLNGNIMIVSFGDSDQTFGLSLK